MNEATIVARLTRAIGQATGAATFCVAGCLPGVQPGLQVQGLGAIRLPLQSSTAKEIIARCRIAPYGKGTQTLVDRGVRNGFELDSDEFQLGEDWNAAITSLLPPIATQLGLPPKGLEARLYKLLVYEKGGFFLPHRDSEKHERMVASLIVVLPSPFAGGALVVRHAGATRTVTCDQAASGEAACFAAFYADCKHEIERVTRGVRLCLTYNLVLKYFGRHTPPAQRIVLTLL